MMMEGVGQDERKQGVRWLNALATLLVFSVGGPLIGGGATILFLMLLNAVPAGFAADLGSAFFFAFATIFVPLFVVGMAVAIMDVRVQPVGIVMACSLGAVAGVCWGLILASMGAAATLSILTFVGSIVAVLACWRLTRWLGRPS